MTLGNAHAEVGSLEERRRKAALAMQTPEQRARELAREKRRTAEREVERQKEREEGEREAAQKRREEEAQILKIAEERERKRGEEGRLKEEKRAEEKRSLLRRRELGIKPLRTFKSDLAEVSASSQMPSWVAAGPFRSFYKKGGVKKSLHCRGRNSSRKQLVYVGDWDSGSARLPCRWSGVHLLREWRRADDS